jgi:hypothetical protein
MELKQCTHLKEGIGIDKDFVKAKKSENGSKFKCLGKFIQKKFFSKGSKKIMSEKQRDKISTIFSMIL